jgi:hypothetical protein
MTKTPETEGRTEGEEVLTISWREGEPYRIECSTIRLNDRIAHVPSFASARSESSNC